MNNSVQTKQHYFFCISLVSLKKKKKKSINLQSLPIEVYKHNGQERKKQMQISNLYLKMTDHQDNLICLKNT